MRKRIWFDFTNSCHPVFFYPIIKELKSLSLQILVTVRNFAQTEELAKKYKFEYQGIGQHGGKYLVFRVANLISRSYELLKYIKPNSPEVGISLNSPYQAIVCKLLGIPFINFMDYEFQPGNYLPFKLATYLFVPEVFPNEYLTRYKSKVIKFKGIKEEIYLANFKPKVNPLNQMKLSGDKIIITMRPPAELALYHRFKNQLFYSLVKYLNKFENVIIVMLPRTKEQKEYIKKMNLPNVVFPPYALDGRGLIFHSDLIISAGGTMNREAVVLGTPAYTVFKGKLGEVDRQLIKEGKLVQIKEKQDFSKIKIEKKHPPKMGSKNYKVKEEVVAKLLELL